MRLFLIPLLLLIGTAAQAGPDITVDHGASSPAISPDGTTLAFSLSGKIWTMPAAGGQARRLTQTDGWEHDATFSPDSQFIAFARQRATGRELVVHNRSTGEDIPLWPGRRWDNQSTDGQEKWHGEARPRGFQFHPSKPVLIVGTGTGFVEVDIFDRTHEQTDGVRLRGFRLSSDGRRALSNFPWETFDFRPPSRLVTDFAKLESKGVSLIDLHTKELKNIFRSKTTNYSVAQFSADQQSIFFVEVEEGIERVIESGLDGARRRVVLSGILANRQIAVHPDGRTLIMAADHKLYSVDIASGAATAIPFTAKVENLNQPAGRIVITNARLFTGDGKTARKGATVTIDDGTVRAVSYRSRAPRPDAGTTVIDAGGKFLMPGLIDSHAHFAYQRALRLPEYVKAGITSILAPGSHFPAAPDRKAAVEAGYIRGPHLYFFSDIIDGKGLNTGLSASITDPSVARGLVRRYADLGYDGIKIYSTLAPEISLAAIDEARKQGLPILSHSGATTWQQAVDAGISALTHLHLYYAACTPFYGAGNIGRDNTAPDRACLKRVFKTMADKGIILDPTLTKGTDAFLPQAQQDRFREREPDKDFAQEEAWNSEVLRMAHEAGVTIVAGTDTTRIPLVVELESYERAGLPRHVILQTATVNGARYLGRADEFGTVAVGKRADLILVDGDPLTRISDLRHITLVIKEGRIVVRR